MQLAYNPYMLLPLFAMLMSLLLANRGWRYRGEPLGKTFLVMMSALAWWSLSVAMEHLSLNLPDKIFWMKMSYFGITAIPVSWLVFNLQYTHRDKWLTRRNLAILTLLPIVTLIIVWSNSAHHLMWKDIWLDTVFVPPLDDVTHGIWFWVYAAYAYSLLALGTLRLAGLFRRSTGIYRNQTRTLLLAALIPWAGNFLYIAGISPFSVVDPTPLAFAMTGGAFYWGMSRLQLLDIIPIAHETVLKSIGDGVVVLDAQQRVVELNPAAQRIIGRVRSEVVGQPYNMVLPGQMAWLDLKPDWVEEQALIAVGEGAEQHYYEVSVSPLGGSQRFTGHVLLLHDGTGRIISEVESRERVMLETELNERKRAGETMDALLKETSRTADEWQKIFDAVTDLVTLISPDHTFLRANAALCRATGKTETELKGMHCYELMHGLTAPIDGCPCVETLRTGLPVTREIRDRKVFYISTASPVFNDGGEIVAVAHTVKDITERKQAADDLARLNEELLSLNSQLEIKVEERTEQLQEAVAAATSSSQAKSEFLASMSHELRTPLNAIIGFSQVLHEQYFGSLNDKQSEYVADIVESGKHLLSLINDILDLSKIEAGKMELEVSPVKIASLVQGSLVMIKEKAMAHNINLEVHTTEDIHELEITGDERRLKQVMFNLLSNATKFTPDGGEIRIETRRDARELTVSVSDSGIGMTPEELKKLFVAFYQASGGLRDKTPGTGLGLAITRSIVEKHGGRIWVESEGLNKGSRFVFTLPIRDPDGNLEGTRNVLPEESGQKTYNI